MSNHPDPIAQHFSDHSTDVIFYSGPVARQGYEDLCQLFARPKRAKLLLVLNTLGGDPNAGYRIARAAIHNYGAENFKILVPSYCKSAGTLICIGASALILADQSELGPLDVQLRKQDELFEQSSGLDILRGMTYLQKEALESFKQYLIDINGGARLSTRVASQIASELVIGLYNPLFGQIDPVKLGEMNSALQIAEHYGNRLNEKSNSLIPGALAKLIMNYPTHGFVIDRSEARSLFRNVSPPSDAEQALCVIAKHLSSDPRFAGSSSATVWPYNAIPLPQPDQPPESPDEPSTTAHVPDRAPDIDGPAAAASESGEHDDGPSQDSVAEQLAVGGQQDHSGADGQA